MLAGNHRHHRRGVVSLGFDPVFFSSAIPRYNPLMDSARIQELCQLGQNELMRMEYLAAEHTLAEAEELAWENRDFDSLARLYMPLQEARRQRRQRCMEGRIQIDIPPAGPRDRASGLRAAECLGHGELLIAGWGTIQPALDARRMAADAGIYVDVFLAAVYPAEAGRIVAIIPTGDITLPPAQAMPIDLLIRRLPAHSIVISDSELAKLSNPAAIMALWEQLHAPFLAAANATVAPIQKIAAYRRTIEVDYACELAHQNLSDTARKLCVKAAG
jgi:hypothetical protein